MVEQSVIKGGNRTDYRNAALGKGMVQFLEIEFFHQIGRTSQPEHGQQVRARTERMETGNQGQCRIRLIPIQAYPNKIGIVIQVLLGEHGPHGVSGQARRINHDRSIVFIHVFNDPLTFTACPLGKITLFPCQDYNILGILILNLTVRIHIA